MASVNIVVAAGSHSGALAALANTLDAAAIPYRTHRSSATLASVAADGIFVCDVFDGPEFTALRDRGCRYDGDVQLVRFLIHQDRGPSVLNLLRPAQRGLSTEIIDDSF